MGKKKFRPSQQPDRGGRLAPHDAPREPSTNHERPIFNLEHLDGDYRLSKCTVEQKAAFADALHRLSKLTWGEIQLARRQGLGHETINREQLRAKRFPPECPPDRNILVFGFGGDKHRMVGYRIDRVFSILFLDPDLSLHPHG